MTSTTNRTFGLLLHELLLCQYLCDRLTLAMEVPCDVFGGDEASPDAITRCGLPDKIFSRGVMPVQWLVPAGCFVAWFAREVVVQITARLTRLSGVMPRTVYFAVEMMLYLKVAGSSQSRIFPPTRAKGYIR